MSAAPIEWQDLMSVPGSLGAVLQEVFSSVDAEEQNRRRRIPRPVERRTAQDVHTVAYPQYAVLPFSEAIQPLLKPSLRAVAERAGLDPTYLSRLIRGQRPLEKYLIEQIARATRVSPGYFLEYRQLVVSRAVLDAMIEDPVSSISAYQVVVRRTSSATGVASLATERSPRAGL